MYSDIVWTGRYRYKCVFWNIHMIRELQAGQQQIVDMLRAFDKIARKHNVTYFLTAGTLIGGMRRGGIIPWDGDGDVGILEEDYHRLKLVLHKELPRGMYFQTPCLNYGASWNPKWWPWGVPKHLECDPKFAHKDNVAKIKAL